MKTLNEITLNDILSGSAVNCKYRGFTVLYHNGNVSIYFKTKYINGFIITSKNISEIKARFYIALFNFRRFSHADILPQ